MRLPSQIIAFSSGVLSMSTSKCCPLGIEIDSPSSGGRSPPQVCVYDHSETYLKVKPLVATVPRPGIMISTLGVSGT